MGKATGADGQNGQNGQDGANGADGQDGVTPMLKIENGYWYISYDNGATWAQLGKATGDDGKDGQNGTNGTDGKDGQDGTNGSDGKDGITPLLKIENGYWYVSYDNGTTWTQFGKATGADGQNGTNGTNGTDGKDGQDGITPQLKIEDGYWYISYDNGATWKELGKATGEDGKEGQNGSNGTDGKDGKDGQDGDSMFQSVTQDDDYVYFTLADGTVIKIAKGGNSDDFIFTITYNANGGTGTMAVDKVYYGYSVEIKACTFTKAGYYFVEWNTDKNGKGAPYKPGFTMSLDKNITLYAIWAVTPPTGIENGYSWIDLGLSVKWATCNVGASKPEDYGDYFAWGEVEPKEEYKWSTYKWCNGTYSTLTKYNTYIEDGPVVDNMTVLEVADDAAAINWGGTWRMPTQAEQSELRSKCTWTWTTQNGVNGYKVTSKSNGNSIFMPAAGYRQVREPDYVGSRSFYWSSSLDTGDPNYAYYLYFVSDNVSSRDYSRHLGYSVRPVCPYCL